MTFFPQFIVGYVGMPRRYHFYAPEYQIWHVMSSMGASVLAVGMLIPAFYLTYSLIKGQKAPQNPWGAIGLEWSHAASPPHPHNFTEIPVVTWEAYEYTPVEHHGPVHDEVESLPKHDGAATK
jgi:cytochrome c oxidase subunit I